MTALDLYPGILLSEIIIGEDGLEYCDWVANEYELSSDGVTFYDKPFGRKFYSLEELGTVIIAPLIDSINTDVSGGVADGSV